MQSCERGFGGEASFVVQNSQFPLPYSYERYYNKNMAEVEMEKTLKSVANRRRLAILNCLRGRKEMSVGGIARQIKLSFRSTSKHLAILYASGLLDREQRNVSMFYKMNLKGHKIFSAISSFE